MGKDTQHVAKQDAQPTGAAGQAVELVSYTTTHTGGDNSIVAMDTVRGRLKGMAQRVVTAARMHAEYFGDDRNKYRCFMVTLTYRPQAAWKPDHIRKCLNAARNHFKSRNRGFRYCWVAELQLRRKKRDGLTSREVMHYHILVFLPMGVGCPHFDKMGWWRYGITETKQVFAPTKYATKYTSKGTTEGENFPRGARICGVGGLSDSQRNEMAWWRMPSYIREQATVADAPRRRVGGGFVLRRTGEILPSQWVVCSRSKGKVILCRRDAAEIRNG